MKILMIFVDMLRAYSQNVCNPSQPFNKLDEALTKWGGVVFSNCYSPSPDTPRGLASIWTGLPPKINGCDARTRYPESYLNENLDNLWKLFERNHLSKNLFISKWFLGEMGSFPKGIKKDAVLYDDDNLQLFLDSVQIKDNSVTFLALSDYHGAADDVHHQENKMYKVYNLVGNELDLIYEKLNRNNFDIVVIFSDHGHMHFAEPNGLINKGRILTYLQIFVKNSGMDSLKRSNKFCSCMDLFPTMAHLLHGLIYNRIDGINLFTDYSRPYLVLEDYLHFTVTLSQVLEWWAIIFPDVIVSTDCLDHWWANGQLVNLHPDQKDLFQKILKSYASQYAENTKAQKILDEYYNNPNSKTNPGPRLRYSTGEERIKEPSPYK